VGVTWKSDQTTIEEMRIFVLATLVGLCMNYPMDSSKQHNHPSNQHDAGFMSGMDFDGFIQDARLPAMARSADVAQDRQGGGGAGFNSPQFNIPFTPNFQFDEFSSPFGNGNSFTQFLSGLGGQSQLGTQGEFVQQTEQRFNRPQIGGGQFKRETPKHHKKTKAHQQAAHRYGSAQYEQPKSNFKQEEVFKRPQPVYKPEIRKNSQQKELYQKYFTPEVRKEEHKPVYHKKIHQKEQVVEARENTFEQDSFEDFGETSKKMEQMFDNQKSQFPESKFEFDFEPAKFENSENNPKPVGKVQGTFSPPALIEKFNKPVKQSKPYPFQVPEKKVEQSPYKIPTKKQKPFKFEASETHEPYPFEAPININDEIQPLSPSNVKPFTNVGDQYKSQGENNYTPSAPSKPKPTPTFESLPDFTNFNAEPKKEQKRPAPTKKPYKYEKKNFREPVKQISRNSGPHQLIRIKSKRPQPKQLAQGRPLQNQNGFRPIVNGPSYRNNPNPGKLVIEEVVRRTEPYKPHEIVYDNQQPLITLDSVSGANGKHFKASNNQDSFAVNVKASFQPNSEPQRARLQRRQGLVHLPSLTLPSRPKKRQRSLLIDEHPYFESAKITRPSSMDTAFVLDTDNFEF